MNMSDYLTPMPEFFDTPVSRTVAFKVRGVPAPQGSKRAFVVNGRAVLTEASAKVKPWRQDVKAAAEEALNGREPLTGPVEVRVTFVLPRPASAPKARFLPDVTPDLDKLARSSMDALTAAGVFDDDKRVCDLHIRKVYGIVPGAEFLIQPIEAEAVEAVA
jgi:Holliday junction resolvase RusA-like endonuclease